LDSNVLHRYTLQAAPGWKFFEPTKSLQESLTSLVLSDVSLKDIVTYKDIRNLVSLSQNAYYVIDALIKIFIELLNCKNAFYRVSGMSYKSIFYREVKIPDSSKAHEFFDSIFECVNHICPGVMKRSAMVDYLQDRLLYLVLFNGVHATRISEIFAMYGTVLEYLLLIKATKDYPSLHKDKGHTWTPQNQRRVLDARESEKQQAQVNASSSSSSSSTEERKDKLNVCPSSDHNSLSCDCPSDVSHT